MRAAARRLPGFRAVRLAHPPGDAVVPLGAARLLSAWRSDHADAGVLTIAFGQRALRCLRRSSKHRSLLSLACGRGGRAGCVAPFVRNRHCERKFSAPDDGWSALVSGGPAADESAAAFLLGEPPAPANGSPQLSARRQRMPGLPGLCGSLRRRDRRAGSRPRTPRRWAPTADIGMPPRSFAGTTGARRTPLVDREQVAIRRLDGRETPNRIRTGDLLERYLHAKARPEDVDRVNRAFAVPSRAGQSTESASKRAR